eukprot:CAMPEP_0185761848 /NCGR_PEP_ID=MMETSP1174-20130828/20797_1 /TAXON_ID=35687 /ORGANISM="Dictyocha speculum, Strain CCMP1381" /LENGTH=124 /DNA_ID=CAMNT_0028443261 /DNA_START=315 /DNA_END=689 /DNA_ORIENTATION=+
MSLRHRDDLLLRHFLCMPHRDKLQSHPGDVLDGSRRHSRWEILSRRSRLISAEELDVFLNSVRRTQCSGRYEGETYDHLNSTMEPVRSTVQFLLPHDETADEYDTEINSQKRMDCVFGLDRSTV